MFVFTQFDYWDQSNWSTHWHPLQNFYGQDRQVQECQACFYTASSKSTSVSQFPVRLWKDWKHSWVLLPSCDAGNKKKKSPHLASSQTKLLNPSHPRERCHPKGPFRMIYISWMILRVFHSSLCFIDTHKKSSFGSLIFHGLPPFFWNDTFLEP